MKIVAYMVLTNKDQLTKHRICSEPKDRFTYVIFETIDEAQDYMLPDQVIKKVHININKTPMWRRTQ